MVAAQPSVSAAPAQNLLEQRLLPGIVWLPRVSQNTNGVLVQFTPFSSHMGVSQVARLLATERDHYQRLLVQPGVVVLSGFNRGQHWLAYVQQSGQGARGYVSTLAKASPCELCQ